MPQAGRPNHHETGEAELAPELRSFAVKRYVVFYLPMPEGIAVIRVLHGARDIPLLADQGGFEP